MIQVVTIRQQIDQALERIPNLDTFLLNQVRAELHREFDASAIALTPAAAFDEIAVKMGYVKRVPTHILPAPTVRPNPRGGFEATRYPDGHPDHFPYGFGDTEAEAIEDLDDTEEQLDTVARQNGYVKADEVEVLKDKIDALDDSLDLIETESDNFDAFVTGSGYIKLDPDKVQVSRGKVETLREILNQCDTTGMLTHEQWIEFVSDLTAALEGKP